MHHLIHFLLYLRALPINILQPILYDVNWLHKLFLLLVDVHIDLFQHLTCLVVALGDADQRVHEELAAGVVATNFAIYA